MRISSKVETPAERRAKVQEEDQSGPPVWTIDEELAQLSDTEVEEQAARYSEELARRREIAEAEQTAIDALRTRQRATGVLDGAEWREPESYLDAVPPGDSRVFQGNLYRNTSGKPLVHSPADAPESWTLVDEGVEPVEPDPEQFEEWEVGMQIVAGETYRYEGSLYRANQDHEAIAGWEPSIEGYLWSRLT